MHIGDAPIPACPEYVPRITYDWNMETGAVGPHPGPCGPCGPRGPDRSNTRSTACPTAARCRGKSRAGVDRARVRRRSATSPSAPPRPGCATSWTKPAAAQSASRTGEQPIAATFRETAAAEWLRYIEQDRGRKPSTVGGYTSIVRTQLLPTFGSMPLQSITRHHRRLAGTDGGVGQLAPPVARSVARHLPPARARSGVYG